MEVNERVWRGIGNIPQSGHDARNDFKKYNAREKFNLNIISLKKIRSLSAEIS